MSILSPGQIIYIQSTENYFYICNQAIMELRKPKKIKLMIIALYNSGCEKEIARCHFNGGIDDAHVYAKTLMEKYTDALYYEVYSEDVYHTLNN